jgi:UDP-N-acetylglucosamine 2-epimerase (non-hydrolysing)
VIVTLHRPANVDHGDVLAGIIAALESIGKEYPVIFPAHPRTQKQIEKANLKAAHVRLMEPLGYLTFLGLMARAKCVLTDSGGIQEETTALGVPCLTIRENTERPVTLNEGTNRLAGTHKEKILAAFQTAITSQFPGTMPEYWDGHAAERVVDILERWVALQK